jgi:hypothetical protein
MSCSFSPQAFNPIANCIQVERAFTLYGNNMVDHNSIPVKLASGSSQFSEAHWGPALKKYAASVNKISDAKWQNILVVAHGYMEPEAETIEIDSSDDSDLDERANIAASSP